MKKFSGLLLALVFCMALTVPAFAVEDVTIGPLTIPGVTGMETVTVSRDSVLNSTELNDGFTREYFFASQKDGKMTVYQVPTGTRLNLFLMNTFYVGDVHMVNGVLTYVDNSGVNLSSLIDYNFRFDKPESHITFLAEGYYAICFADSTALFNDAVIHVTDTPTQPVQPTTPAAPSFTDVTAADYFYDSVSWAVDRAITNGTSTTTFSPNATCTQAQIITFLWRANSSPKGYAPSGLGAVPTDYFYDAVNWAAARGIIDSTFSPSAPCTRAAAVTYLYRNAGSPAVSYGGKFADVSAGTVGSAVQWALDKGVTTGTGETTFSPYATCTRGQIVTFLYRDLG